MKFDVSLFLVFCGLFAGYYFGVREAPEHDLSKWELLGFALFLSIFAFSGVCFGVAGVRSFQHRCALSDSLKSGKPLDGNFHAAVGTAAAIGEPMLSPLTKTPCIAYEYWIFREFLRTDSNGGSTTEVANFFSGLALGPSQVMTQPSPMAIRSFPELADWPGHKIAREVAAPNFNEYVSRNSPQNVLNRDCHKVLRELKYTDCDGAGAIRGDHRYHERKVTGELHFLEKVIRPGDPVCITGCYSKQLGGLVTNLKKKIRCMANQGTAQDALKKAQSSIRGYFTASIILLIVPNLFLLAFYLLD